MAGHLTKSSNSGFDDDMNSDPSAMTLPGDHAPVRMRFLAGGGRRRLAQLLPLISVEHQTPG